MLSAGIDSISLEFNWNICKCHLYWYVDASDIIMNQNSIVWMFRKCFRFESWMSLGGFWKHSHLSCLHSDLFFKTLTSYFWFEMAAFHCWLLTFEVGMLKRHVLVTTSANVVEQEIFKRKKKTYELA